MSKWPDDQTAHVLAWVDHCKDNGLSFRDTVVDRLRDMTGISRPWKTIESKLSHYQQDFSTVKDTPYMKTLLKEGTATFPDLSGDSYLARKVREIKASLAANQPAGRVAQNADDGQHEDDEDNGEYKDQGDHEDHQVREARAAPGEDDNSSVPVAQGANNQANAPNRESLANMARQALAHQPEQRENHATELENARLRKENMDLQLEVKALQAGLFTALGGEEGKAEQRVLESIALLIAKIKQSCDSLSIHEPVQTTSEKLRQWMESAFGKALFAAWEIGLEHPEEYLRSLVTAHIFHDILSNTFPAHPWGLSNECIRLQFEAQMQRGS